MALSRAVGRNGFVQNKKLPLPYIYTKSRVFVNSNNNNPVNTA